MYRVFLWEGIVMKDDDPSKQLSIEGTHVSLANGTLTASNMTPNADSSNKIGTASPEPKAKLATSIKEDNARAIRTLVQNLSKVTTPLFQAVVKLFLYSRRNPEIASRGQANEVAIHTTKVLIRHLEWRGSGYRS
jgi:E3 ubiquitin-protein ligase HUWE1